MVPYATLKTLRIRTSNILLALFMAACVSAPAANITLNELALVNSSPMRIGVNVSTSNYYDGGQLFKNLLFTTNPGFEGYIQQEIIGCASGTSTSCVNYYPYDQAPNNYWAGATAYFCCSASSGNSNLGLTRTITSSTTANGTVGPTYTFSSALAQPLTIDDYFSAVLQVNSTGTTMPGWVLSGAATGETTNVPPGSAGAQALSLPAGACATGYADTTGSHDFIILQTGQTFGFSLKSIAVSGQPVIMVSIKRQGGLGGGVSPSSGTMTPGSSWGTQSLSFNGAEAQGAVYGDLQVQICNSGTGTAYVDDADLERTSNLNASNTSMYRDEVVASLNAINPGSLRLWDYQLGETLADWTNPLFGRHFQSSLEGQSYITPTSGRNAGATAQGLADFLGLCELTGAKPWITIPLAWPATDYSNLIDYLAGGSGTTYGAKRIANGHALPYTTTLGNVYIEFGNEPWNSAFAGINMPNFSYSSTSNGMLSYGHWSNTAMSAMKSNANFSAAIKLIVNMQAASTYEFTTHVLPNNTRLDAVSVAPYIGTGQLNNAGTLPAEWNPDTAFTWGDSNDTTGNTGNGWTYAYVHAGATPVYVYEDNENQVNGSAPSSVIQNHNSSFMTGTVVAQQMLEHLKILGPNAPQNMWSLTQDQFNNASSVEIPLYGIMKEAGGEFAGTGSFIQRPLALAAQIANDSMIGPEYSATITNADTYSTGASNGINPESNVPYEFVYCFKNNSNRSCVLVNTDPLNTHTFTLTGTNVPTTVTTRTLSMSGGNIDTCNNESASPCVSIVTRTGVAVANGAIAVAPGTIEAIDFVAGANPVPAIPLISAVSASGITTTSATVNWTTDQPSTSQVEYGTTAGYGSVSTLSATLSTAHSITLTGLTPGTTYSFAALSTDSAGTATSGNFTFATAVSIPVISNITTSGITATTATINWATAPPSSSQVEFGTTAAYGSLSSLNSTLSTAHSVTLTGLTPGTTYNFAVIAADSAGTATSGNSTFVTTTSIPVISSVTSGGLSGTSATITWATDQPSSSQVEFGTTAAYGSLSLLNSALVTSHSVILTGLTPGTAYSFAVLSTNPAGTATSANFTFSTTVPLPSISGVAISGITATSATVTWNTDQASNSQLSYGTSQAYGLLSSLNSALVTSHSVTLTGLASNTTYNFAVLSTDAAGTAKSSNFSFATLPVTVVAPASAISPIGGAHGNTGSSLTPVALTVPYHSGNNNTIVMACALGNTSASISSITDAGSTWTFRTYTSNGSAVRSELWSTSVNGSVASNSFTVALSSGSPTSCVLEEYSGVGSIGQTAANVSSSGIWSVGLTTQDPNNYVVAGLGANSYNGYTANAGTIRQLSGLTANSGNNYVEMALCDNTAPTASLVACTSVSGPAPSAAAALELRTLNISTGSTPVISGVTSTGITANSATINWTTDQPSSSQIKFGTTNAYGSFSPLNATLVTSHSVTLTGLTTGATYNFAAISTDTAGTAASPNFTFTTLVSIPAISNVTISGITATSATINWITDQPSSSQVQFGTTAAYGALSVLNSALVTSHSVTLTGLTTGVTYNFAAISADTAGTAASPNFTFTTLVSIPAISNVTISGITATSATINWITDQPSSSQVQFGTTAGYGALSVLNSALVTSHSVTLTGLTAGTTYNFAAISTDTAGTATSPNFNLTTIVPIPKISDVTISGITATSATINWTTDQPSSSQVQFGTTTAYGALSVLNPALVTSHSVTLTGLTTGVTYNFAAISTDTAGTATSPNFNLTTIVPIPKISNVTISGITATSATINWTTDQPSSSQVQFGTTAAYGALSVRNPALVTSHSVTLTGLTAGTTYNFAAISGNAAGTSASGNFTFGTRSASTPPTSSAISPVGGTHNNSGSAAAASALTLAYTSSTGNTLVAACALGITSSSISSIRDSGGSVWSLRAFVNNGTAVRSEIWSTGAGGSIASTSLTINISGGSPVSCSVEEYSGVAGIGITSTNTGTSGTWSAGLITEDPNDYLVAGLGANSYYGYTVISGAARQLAGLTGNPGPNYTEMALCDQPAALPAAVACTSVSGTAPWAALALELRSGASLNGQP